MDTKSLSDYINTIQENSKRVLEICDSQEQKLNALQDKLEKSEELAKCVGLIENHALFKEQAEAEGITIQEWIVRTLHSACQSDSSLPIHPEVYRRLQSLAVGKGISIRELGESDDISSVLSEALDNHRL